MVFRRDTAPVGSRAVCGSGANRSGPVRSSEFFSAKAWSQKNHNLRGYEKRLLGWVITGQVIKPNGPYVDKKETKWESSVLGMTG